MKGFHDGFDDALVSGAGAGIGFIAGNFLNSKLTGNLQYIPLVGGVVGLGAGVFLHKHPLMSSLFIGFGIGLIVSGIGVVLPQFSGFV